MSVKVTGVRKNHLQLLLYQLHKNSRALPELGRRIYNALLPKAFYFRLGLDPGSAALVALPTILGLADLIFFRSSISHYAESCNIADLSRILHNVKC